MIKLLEILNKIIKSAYNKDFLVKETYLPEPLYGYFLTKVEVGWSETVQTPDSIQFC